MLSTAAARPPEPRVSLFKKKIANTVIFSLRQIALGIQFSILCDPKAHEIN